MDSRRTRRPTFTAEEWLERRREQDRRRHAERRARQRREQTQARRDVERLRCSPARASETVEETAARRDERNIVERLQTMLHVHNTYVRSFKTALHAGDVPDLRLKIDADRTPQGEHPRRFNAPTPNEVAVLIAGNTCENRDVVLRLHDSTLKHILFERGLYYFDLPPERGFLFERGFYSREGSNRASTVPETHRSYDALQYPLLFPCGDDGYHFQYRQKNPTTKQETTMKVSAMTFYAYRIMVREDSFNTILKCRQLFHQYVVDMWGGGGVGCL